MIFLTPTKMSKNLTCVMIT